MVNSCCAFGCTNRFKKNCGIGFFRFPPDPVRRKLWTLALRRKNFEPTRTSVVCGEHFVTGRPSKDSEHPDYVPNIFIFKPSKKIHLSSSKKRPCEITENFENESFIPGMVINLETLCTSSSFKTDDISEMEGEISKQKKELQQEYTENRVLMDEEDKLQIALKAEVSEKEEELSNLRLELQHVHSTLHAVTEEKDKLAKELSTAHVTQNVLRNSVSDKERELLRVKWQLQQAYTEVNALRSEKEELQKKLSATDITQRILQDPRKLHFYTGLNSVKDFNLILSLVSKVENNVKVISLETQVLIVLMKLKLNLWFTDLAYRFKASSSTIHRICITMIPFLEKKLDSLVRNPINNALKKNIPVCYKNTVYENLYQRLHKKSKFNTKQSENEDIDLDIMET